MSYRHIPRNYTGAPPYYDMEIDISACLPFDHDLVTINSFGEVLDGTPVNAHNSRRHAAIARQMMNRIMAEEDARIFKILDAIAQSGNNDI